MSVKNKCCWYKTRLPQWRRSRDRPDSRRQTSDDSKTSDVQTSDVRICTAFKGSTKLASGPLMEVAQKAKAATDADAGAQILIFDDADARRIEVDFRGSAEDVVARLAHERPGK